MGEEKSKEAQPVDRSAATIAANREVANRIREVAKWLILVFGAIGGVLLTGAQLSDLGKDGTDVGLAIAGIVVGLVGAAIALGFTVFVLLPTKITLSKLAAEEKDSGMAELVAEDPGLLDGYAKTITAFTRVRKEAIEAVTAAREKLEANRDGTEAEDLKKDLETAEAKRKQIGATSGELLSIALMEKVKRRMVIATVAFFAGGIIVAGGIVLFSWATNQSEDKPAGEAVPAHPSAVVVRLSLRGQESLAKGLGARCDTSALRAIALGGPPNALEMVAVPSALCKPIRFVLTPSVGHADSEQRVKLRQPAAGP